MFERIIRFAIAQRWLVMLATIALIGLGIYNYQRLPIDAVPDITNVQVQINTEAPGYSPLEVEQRVMKTAAQDGRSVQIIIPQDPGSAGKAMSDNVFRQLAGYKVPRRIVLVDEVVRSPAGKAAFSSQPSREMNPYSSNMA